MTMLSNILADLAEQVKAASSASTDAERTSIAKALEAGALLVQAKDACSHGEWLPFLERAGVPERKAQRLIRLARSGLKSDTVSDLGGIRATLDWLQQLTLPTTGNVLMVSLDGFDQTGTAPLAFVWPDPAGFHVAMIDLSPAVPHMIVTKKPMKSVMVVHATLFRVLDFRFSEMVFQMVPEHLPGVDLYSLRDDVLRSEAGAHG